MAVKKKKLNDFEDFNGLGQGYTNVMNGGGGAKSSAPALPKATSYQPYQPETPAYTEGQISAGEPLDYGAMRAPAAGLNSNETRMRARQGYTFDMGDVNRRLMEAAMAYGNAPQVTQYGLGAGGEDTSSVADVAADPNSAWQNIDRFSTENMRNIDEDLNNRGSFFSGAHLERDQKLGDEVGRQRLAATNDWQSTLADLGSSIARSRGSRDDALRQADIQDALEALANARTAPVAAPTGEDPGAVERYLRAMYDASEKMKSNTQVPLPQNYGGPVPIATVAGIGDFNNIEAQPTTNNRKKKGR